MVFVVSFGFRAWFVGSTQHHPISDARHYERRAHHILQHGAMPDGAYRTPAYPYLLASILKGGGARDPLLASLRAGVGAFGSLRGRPNVDVSQPRFRELSDPLFCIFVALLVSDLGFGTQRLGKRLSRRVKAILAALAVVGCVAFEATALWTPLYTLQPLTSLRRPSASRTTAYSFVHTARRAFGPRPILLHG